MTDWNVIEGDCVETMAGMEACSVDAVVCDPPYGLEFMGKEWDRLSDDAPRKSQIPSPAQAGYVMKSRGEAINRLPKDHGKRQQDWHETWAREALRVLRPGGHLLAFGGSRTAHRLACAIEDAGFEIRDRILYMNGGGDADPNLGAEIDWLYGSG